MGNMKHSENESARNFDTSLVLITGMSGGGRRTAATILEEMGWYVADNLPPELIVRMAELSFASDSPIERLAVVTDVRSRAFAGSLTSVLNELNGQGRKPVLLFLDADDQRLVTRFDTVRRTHPLQGNETLQTGITREREVLGAIRDRADIVIDTTDMSIHDLRREIERAFGIIEHNHQHVTIQSFGFKHGAPRDADLQLDMRFLANPHWIPELRTFTGMDHEVSDYVLKQPGVNEFIDSFMHMFGIMLKGYRHEGKNFVTLAIGCTGGKHRSVAISEEIGRRLRVDGVDVTVSHRDCRRE